MNKEKNERFRRVMNKPKTMSLRVSDELYEKIRIMAEKDNVSLTSVLTRAVTKYIRSSAPTTS